MKNFDDLTQDYKRFLGLVRKEMQIERSQVNRKMFWVVLWCFIIPALIGSFFLVGIKLHLLPRSIRSSLDLIFLFFPVTYSMYFLMSQIGRDLKSHFRREGLGIQLVQNERDGQWRGDMCSKLSMQLSFSKAQWSWVCNNFAMDLDNLRNRTKYITALAGAVFYLIMQGIDSISPSSEYWSHSDSYFQNPVQRLLLGPIAAEVSQYLGLTLFLILLYLSGMQAHASLQRYLACAKLLEQNSNL